MVILVRTACVGDVDLSIATYRTDMLFWAGRGGGAVRARTTERARWADIVCHQTANIYCRPKRLSRYLIHSANPFINLPNLRESSDTEPHTRAGGLSFKAFTPTICIKLTLFDRCLHHCRFFVYFFGEFPILINFYFKSILVKYYCVILYLYFVFTLIAQNLMTQTLVWIHSLLFHYNLVLSFVYKKPLLFVQFFAIGNCTKTKPKAHLFFK